MFKLKSSLSTTSTDKFLDFSCVSQSQINHYMLDYGGTVIIGMSKSRVYSQIKLVSILTELRVVSGTC